MKRLDTSYDCWHGAYSAFCRWRQKLAHVAGFPPLYLMEHYCEASYNDWTREVHPANAVSTDAVEVLRACEGVLPIHWDYFKDDPLTVLLNPSDWDGKIAHEDCLPLADRLQGMMPRLPDVNDLSHIGNWRDTTQQFIDGLRRAHEVGEAVDFYSGGTMSVFRLTLAHGARYKDFVGDLIWSGHRLWRSVRCDSHT